MTGSYSFSDSFTEAHARKLAGRVTTDLHQCSSLYGDPSRSWVERYQAELEVLLGGGYVSKYQFGYTRNGSIAWSLRYTVGPDGGLVSNDRGGGVPPGEDITGAAYFNSLTLSSSWDTLSPAAQAGIEALLPFSRSVRELPSSASGYWTRDRGYTAGGVLIDREVFRRIA
jgi:hypothetical protein